MYCINIEKEKYNQKAMTHKKVVIKPKSTLGHKKLNAYHMYVKEQMPLIKDHAEIAASWKTLSSVDRRKYKTATQQHNYNVISQL